MKIKTTKEIKSILLNMVDILIENKDYCRGRILYHFADKIEKEPNYTRQNIKKLYGHFGNFFDLENNNEFKILKDRLHAFLFRDFQLVTQTAHSDVIQEEYKMKPLNQDNKSPISPVNAVINRIAKIKNDVRRTYSFLFKK
ncbi:MAG: hypothetical protein ABF760_03090 [Zymomonas mobilis]|uniref:Uncharacterized protein n=1 Tax=Zymomonas mobilis TaxID=542 RepID=A0A542W351_ZYMMB|nr:hypothetical protein [Zymomonas mobilis]TQL18001.1 hypothetical protein FBY58_1615 [Zymomonas mobilis]